MPDTEWQRPSVIAHPHGLLCTGELALLAPPRQAEPQCARAADCWAGDAGAEAAGLCLGMSIGLHFARHCGCP
eukprot:6722021-Alexandrium_andersonii.AAC.1